MTVHSAGLLGFEVALPREVPKMAEPFGAFMKGVAESGKHTTVVTDLVKLSA